MLLFIWRTVKYSCLHLVHQLSVTGIIEMSDLENELLGLAESEPRRKRNKPKSEA